MSKARELFHAIREEDREKCLSLLNKGLSKKEINAMVEGKQTCLTEACVFDDKEIVQKIIYKGADCNHRTSTGKTPLIIAADNCHTAVMRTLIEESDDCEVNACDEDGQTALHFVARNGATEAAEVLLEAKAKVNAKTEDGQTPLFLALKRGHVSCAEVLLQYGGNANIHTEPERRTPLHAAAMSRDPHGIKLILDRCTDVNVTDFQGNTALHLLVNRSSKQATEADVLECCKLLVENNLDISLKNDFNKSAQDYASEHHMPSVTRFLQEAVVRPREPTHGHTKRKLNAKVEELETGQRRLSSTVEGLAGTVHKLNKGQQNLTKTVEKVECRGTENSLQLHHLKNAMENLKDDLDRAGTRPRTATQRKPSTNSQTGNYNAEQQIDLRNRIRNRMTDLTDHIKMDIHQHLDYLWSKEVLSSNEHEVISNIDTSLNQARQLIIRIVDKKSAKSIYWFVRSLRKHENTIHLVKEIDPNDWSLEKGLF